MDEKESRNKLKIQVILDADSPFKIIGLPFPVLNYRGKPVWNFLRKEIEDKYKKLTVQIHPDKNQDSEDSRIAFSKLKEAYDSLNDFSKRNKAVKNYIEKNTHPKLGFIPEGLKNAPAEEIEQFQNKSRKRQKGINQEHFDLYRNEMKNQFYKRRSRALNKRQREEFNKKEMKQSAEKYLGAKENEVTENGSESDSGENRRASLGKVGRKKRLKLC